MPHPLFFVAGAVIIIGTGYLIINELKNQSNEERWYKNYCEMVRTDDVEIDVNQRRKKRRSSNQSDLKKKQNRHGSSSSGEEEEEEDDDDEVLKGEKKSLLLPKNFSDPQQPIRKRNLPRSKPNQRDGDFPLIDLSNQSYPPTYPGIKNQPQIITTTNLQQPKIQSTSQSTLIDSKTKYESNQKSIESLSKEEEEEDEKQQRLEKIFLAPSSVQEADEYEEEKEDDEDDNQIDQSIYKSFVDSRETSRDQDQIRELWNDEGSDDEGFENYDQSFTNPLSIGSISNSSNDEDGEEEDVNENYRENKLASSCSTFNFHHNKSSNESDDKIHEDNRIGTGDGSRKVRGSYRFGDEEFLRNEVWVSKSDEKAEKVRESDEPPIASTSKLTMKRSTDDVRSIDCGSEAEIRKDLIEIDEDSEKSYDREFRPSEISFTNDRSSLNSSPVLLDKNNLKKKSRSNFSSNDGVDDEFSEDENWSTLESCLSKK